MQGFNMGRYVPPGAEDPSLSGGKTGGFNSSKGHPLGKRFSKVKEGIITIRFEVPFDVWCETCQPEFLIKQGVRFNAQKKKAGTYLSTPIYEFNFRHPPCGGTIAVRTDPENTQYVVAAGGRKKAGAYTTAFDADYGEILTKEERERRRNDAFARLEGQTEEKTQIKTDATRINELYEVQEKYWKDPYRLNRLARDQLRPERKRRAAVEKEKEAMSELYGLGFELLDHTREDADQAAMLEYGTAYDADKALDKALTKPMFEESIATGDAPRKPSDMTRAAWKKQQTTDNFKRDVTANTRAKANPFNSDIDWSQPKRQSKSATPNQIEIVQRTKRAASQEHLDPAPKFARLVGYAESDDDSEG